MTEQLQMDWKQVHAELGRVGKAKSALDWELGRWLLLALRTQVHRHLGLGSFAEYSERMLGYSPRTTEERLRAAETLEQLPGLTQALREGAVPWSVVRELTRVAVPDTEAEWLAAGRDKTLRQVERLVSGRKPGDRPSDPADPRARRHVLRFDVSAETFPTFREAVAALCRATGERLDNDAALMMMARWILGGPSDEGRASYQIAVTVCERCGAGTQQGKGEAIPVRSEVVEMVECDAQHVDVGEPSLRATQTVPPAVRRHVARRDGGCCRVPGCRSAVFLDLHHVEPRADGGDHDPESMLMLCATHHRAVHDGTLLVEGRASSGFTFRYADGSEYGQLPSAEEAERCAKLFQALRRLGFRETASRQAVNAVRAHVGARCESGNDAARCTGFAHWVDRRVRTPSLERFTGCANRSTPYAPAWASVRRKSEESGSVAAVRAGVDAVRGERQHLGPVVAVRARKRCSVPR